MVKGCYKCLFLSGQAVFETGELVESDAALEGRVEKAFAWAFPVPCRALCAFLVMWAQEGDRVLLALI